MSRCTTPSLNQSESGQAADCSVCGTAELETRAASDSEKRHASRVGAVGKGAPKVSLISVQAACNVLRDFDMPAELVQAVSALQTAPAMTAAALGKLPAPMQQHEQLACITHVPGNGSTAQAQQYQPLPVTLPECTVPKHKMKKHYSLPMPQRNRDPLQSELNSFHAWATNKVQLDRDRAPICGRTWLNILSSIMLFMGFLSFHVPKEQWVTLSLWLLLDGNLFAAFISFQIKKGNNIHSLTQEISHTKKVLSYLEVRGNSQQAEAVQLQKQLLTRLSSQLSHAMPKKRKDPEEMKEANMWTDAHVIVQAFDRYRVAVLQEVTCCQAHHCPQWLSKALHDACMACMMFGYIPPIRSACLRELQIPDPAGTCLNQECSKQSCKGNRLEWKGEELWLCLPHHKTEKAWDGASIDICLPAELSELVRVYLDRGHRVFGGEDMQYVFGRGTLFKAPAFSYYFQQVMKRTGIKQHIPAHTLRHIFITERRGEERADGPLDASAAQIMGNCEAQWDRAYDLKFSRREAKKAMKAMPAWREAMLSKPLSDEDDDHAQVSSASSDTESDQAAGS